MPIAVRRDLQAASPPDVETPIYSSTCKNDQ
jgi:hypothetical protein